jgi:hypothetical protein
MKAVLAIVIIFALAVNASPFQQTFDLINQVRSEYGLHPLSWDAKLSRDATNMAQTCSNDAQPQAGTKATFGFSILEKIGQEANNDCASHACVGGDCESYRQLVSDQDTHI